MNLRFSDQKSGHSLEETQRKRKIINTQKSVRFTVTEHLWLPTDHFGFREWQENFSLFTFQCHRASLPTPAERIPYLKLEDQRIVVSSRAQQS